jgi:hypothetical protein
MKGPRRLVSSFWLVIEETIHNSLGIFKKI